MMKWNEWWCTLSIYCPLIIETWILLWADSVHLNSILVSTPHLHRDLAAMKREVIWYCVALHLCSNLMEQQGVSLSQHNSDLLMVSAGIESPGSSVFDLPIQPVAPNPIGVLHPAFQLSSIQDNELSFVIISGGTGGNAICSAFGNACYVLPVSDDGGSSSEIIRVLGGPSVGMNNAYGIRTWLTLSSRGSLQKGIFAHDWSGWFHLPPLPYPWKLFAAFFPIGCQQSVKRRKREMNGEI